MVLEKIALVALLFEVAFCAQRPSEDEFNLFCRIFAETSDMMLEPDYVYDEDKDRAILREMEVLFNATTDNMDEFRKTLWVTKNFFEEHPPPTRPESRKRAHREIGQLIEEVQRKIQESRELAKQTNQKMEEAKLSVARGIYGDHVTVVPKEDGNLTDIRSNTTSIFEDHTNVTASCGGGDNPAGKTLLNDFFCACVGEGDSSKNPSSPCHGDFVPPKNGNNNCCKKECCKSGCCANKDCCNCCWTQMKHQRGANPALSLTESFEKIEEACRDLLWGKKETKKITDLLDEYVKMIGHGGAKKALGKKHMFGQSGWGANDGTAKEKLKECTGTGDNGGSDGWKNNNKICVDYSHNFKDGKTYDIPWHNKFREASEKLQDAKKLEERILKNRADLLLLKSQAWVAYSREKDDETSNLDDMNVSNLFDGARVSPPFLHSVFFFYF